jgi:putative ABC transport system permease protein
MNALLHLERLWQDVKHGARVFARNRALTAIAVLSIACGTGANVAMFGVADAMLLRPLPVSRPGDLLTLGFKSETATRLEQGHASYLDYQDLRARTRSFDGILAYDYGTVGMTLRRGDPPRVRFASFVSDNFFSVLGVPLPLGREFRTDEVSAGTPARVVILTDAVWRADFDSDPSIAGTTMRIGGMDFTIVGVAPESFSGLHQFVREAVFLPMGVLPLLVDAHSPALLETRHARVFGLKGRLREGVSIAEARAELDTVGRALEQAYPESNKDRRLVAQTEIAFKFEQRPLDASLIVLLLALSGAVLCVACANVAGLLASRAPVRAREMSLRLAIGAGRGRLVRQLLTETLGIAVAGGAAGLGVAQLGIAVLRGIQFPSDMIAPPTLVLDRRALAVSLVVAMASAILAGLGPAVQTTRVDLAGALKSSGQAGRGRRRLRVRSTLVAIQVALSLVLLTISTFTFQMFSRELRNGPGFRTTQIAKVTIDAGQGHYRDAEAMRFFAGILEQARALPGVRSASLTSSMPLFSYRFASVVREGEELPDGQTGRLAWAASVDDQYFTTMNNPLVTGRAFTPADDADAAGVAILNTVLARQLWPDGDAIGRKIQVLDQDGRRATVVGIVQPTKQQFPGERPQPAIFFPYLQQPRGQMVLLAHTDGPSASVLDALRAVARRPDPAVPVFDAQTIERFCYVLFEAQFATVVRMIGGIGLMGMALTMVGLYGLVSYAVSSRTREIGIRMAIGATHGNVVRMVLRQSMFPVWLGLPLGLALSVVASSVLVGMVPTDERVTSGIYWLVVPGLVSMTLFAATVPARYAARINPTVALRSE